MTLVTPNYQIIEKKKKEKESGYLYFAEWGPKMGFPSKVTILLPHTYTVTDKKQKKNREKEKEN